MSHLFTSTSSACCTRVLIAVVPMLNSQSEFWISTVGRNGTMSFMNEVHFDRPKVITSPDGTPVLLFLIGVPLSNSGTACLGAPCTGLCSGTGTWLLLLTANGGAPKLCIYSKLAWLTNLSLFRGTTWYANRMSWFYPLVGRQLEIDLLVIFKCRLNNGRPIHKEIQFRIIRTTAFFGICSILWG